MTTISELIARWNTGDGMPYKGSLIDMEAFYAERDAAIALRDTIAQDRERHAACFVAAMKRLTAAADAWQAFKDAITTTDHFAACDALDAALILAEIDRLDRAAYKEAVK